MSEPDVDRIYELDKAIMYADSPGAPGKRAKLVWSTRKTYPRLSIFTNDPADKGNGLITAPLDTPTLYGILDIMDTVLRATEEMKQKIDIYTSKWENNQRTNEMVLLSTVWVGKNANGINWISLVSSDPVRPKVIFEYQTGDYYQFFKKDGAQYTKAETSNLALAAAIRLLRNFFENNPIANTSSKLPRQPAMTEFNSEPPPPNTFEDINF